MPFFDFWRWFSVQIVAPTEKILVITGTDFYVTGTCFLSLVLKTFKENKNIS